jgi:hypothetical protein
MWSNVWWGTSGGLIGAALYSIIVLVVYAIQGPDALARDHVTLGSVLALYWAGGIIVGAIVGVLRPLTKVRLGAIAVGFIAALPVMAGASFLVDGVRGLLDPGSRFVSVFCSLVLGGYGGNMLWRRTRPPSKSEQGHG